MAIGLMKARLIVCRYCHREFISRPKSVNSLGVCYYAGVHPEFIEGAPSAAETR